MKKMLSINLERKQTEKKHRKHSKKEKNENEIQFKSLRQFVCFSYLNKIFVLFFIFMTHRQNAI